MLSLNVKINKLELSALTYWLGYVVNSLFDNF